MVLATTNLDADDWPRFRGPAGSGIANDSESLPSVWSTETNLAWKATLPGPGASSPIIVGEKVFVFLLGKEVRQLAVNSVTTEKEAFWGSPAVSNGRMVLRSSAFLYCIAGNRNTGTKMKREQAIDSGNSDLHSTR